MNHVFYDNDWVNNECLKILEVEAVLNSNNKTATPGLYLKDN